MERLDAVVVGAGPAGLAASAALSSLGVEHVVLESGRVGETWRSKRWDSFRLNTPGAMNGMLGPLADDEYSTRDEVVRRLDVLGSACPVRENVTVTGLSLRDQAVELSTSDGPVHARAAVVATGAENVPRIPDGAARLAPRVLQLSTATYRSPQALPDGAVLVVGSGQSGVQIVEDLLAAGRRVLLSTSEVGRLPTPYRGRPTIFWLLAAGFFDQRPQDLPDPAMMRRPNPLLAPAGDHSLDLRTLARDGVELLGRVQGVDGEHVGVDGSVRRNIASGEEFALRALAMADGAIARLDTPAPPAPPEPDAPYPLRDIDELDLRREGVTTVVWTAGMLGSHRWLPAELLDETGSPRHRSGASDAPGLWFVGLRWMLHRASTNFYGMPSDAEHVAAAVSAHLGGSTG